MPCNTSLLPSEEMSNVGDCVTDFIKILLVNHDHKAILSGQTTLDLNYFQN